MTLSYLIDKCFHSRIRVRNTICKVNFSIWFLEIVLKLKLVGLSLKPISTISLNKTHVKSILLSPFLFCTFLLSLLTWFINVRFHSLVVESLSFTDVTNIELDISQKILIIHLKVVPIRMAFGISVTPQ